MISIKFKQPSLQNPVIRFYSRQHKNGFAKEKLLMMTDEMFFLKNKIV